MRLVIDVPATWAPGITVSVAPPLVLPGNPKPWIEGLASADLPPGRHAEVTRTTDARTRDGWPVRLIEADVRDGDAVAGARVIAVYLFLEHGASATVSGADLAGHRDEIVSVLLAGAPEWRGEEAVAVAEVWDLPAD